MAICAYCSSKDVKMTREHLWPASLHKRYAEGSKLEDDEYTENFYIRKVPDKMLAVEIQIKDVCEQCNNGVLSMLDSYICSLWDKYFSTMRLFGEEFCFEYDFDLLSRWLFKMNFNSARIHNSDDIDFLKKTRNYIIGKQKRPDKYALFVRIYSPTNLTKHFDGKELQEKRAKLGSDVLGPRLNRVSTFHLKTRYRKAFLKRAVSLHSFCFFQILLPKKVSFKYWRIVLEDFQRRVPETVRLTPDTSRIVLHTGSIDFTETMQYMYGELVHVGDEQIPIMGQFPKVNYL